MQCKNQWHPPRKIRNLTHEQRQGLRQTIGISVEGDLAIAPIPDFKSMRFPNSLINALNRVALNKLTAVQSQCIPATLLKQNFVCLAPNNSGKTTCALLASLLVSLDRELRMRLTFQEGPFALLVVPYREQASQLARTFTRLSDALRQEGYPEMKVCECVGGSDMKDQEERIRHGCHVVIGTTGRLLQLLEKDTLLLDQCELISLLSYRLLEEDFEEQTYRLMKYVDSVRKDITKCFYTTNTSSRIERFQELHMRNSAIISAVTVKTEMEAIQHSFRLVDKQDKLEALEQELRSLKQGEKVVVIGENHQLCCDLETFLVGKSQPVCNLYTSKVNLRPTDLEYQSNRERELAKFDGKQASILVATEGITLARSFAGVSLLINYTLPSSYTNYKERLTLLNGHGKCTTLLTCADSKAVYNEIQRHIPSISLK